MRNCTFRLGTFFLMDPVYTRQTVLQQHVKYYENSIWCDDMTSSHSSSCRHQSGCSHRITTRGSCGTRSGSCSITCGCCRGSCTSCRRWRSSTSCHHCDCIHSTHNKLSYCWLTVQCDYCRPMSPQKWHKVMQVPLYRVSDLGRIELYHWSIPLTLFNTMSNCWLTSIRNQLHKSRFRYILVVNTLAVQYAACLMIVTLSHSDKNCYR